LQDFTVDISTNTLAKSIVSELEFNKVIDVDKNLALLQLLKSFDCVVDYTNYIGAIDTLKNLTVNQKLQIIEIKQRCGLHYSSDFLNNIKAKTIFGNVFYTDKDVANTLISGNIRNTLIAYRILRAENKTDSVLAEIRRYLLESKKECGWWNTYETAQILQTILPDVLKNKTKWEKSELRLTGDVNKTVTKFPFEITFTPQSGISISKKGFDAVYLNTYQRKWNVNPQPKTGSFVIDTHFDNNHRTLEAGKPVKLIVNLEVKKDADYVMIKIPIPGGCSYGSKNDGYHWNEYREHYKNETIIYCQKLKNGNYTYEINLVPRFNGEFTLNPAQVELMYFPVFNGNNEIKKLKVN